MDLPPAPTPPVNSGDGPSSADRTTSLLNLLKFSGGPSAQQPQAQQTQAAAAQRFHHQDQSEDSRGDEREHPPVQSQFEQQDRLGYHRPPQQALPMSQYPTRIHQPAPAGADPTGLLAALMRGAQEAEEPKQAPKPEPPVQAPQPFAGGSPSADTTSYLLNLLNRPKPSQTEQPMLAEAASQLKAHSGDAHAQYQEQRQPYFGMPQYQRSHQMSKPEETSPPAIQEPSADSAALYQQLMGTLNTASAHGGSSAFQTLKKENGSPAGSQHHGSHHSGSAHSPVASPLERSQRHSDRNSSLHSHHSSHLSVKQTPPSLRSHDAADKDTETVSKAISNIAEQADQDARHALERAEHQANEDSRGQDIVAAAKDVQHQIDAIDDAAYDSDSAEQTMIRDIQQSVQSIIDEAQVADSWESADQDEIVVIEEKELPPIKVFNFPMKPWISISMQDIVEPRPEFREESIMDIARLKKEFDQMDRNLYTASQTYMTYGMSKQGGLRVIRQDDGKDAKVFTDTKDRIFNLAMSVTPQDYEGAHREAIIGTGVSGTVYWVQIKNGDKDHIDDTHLEQYGFALPPMSSQDGDAPGGVLKTRARASTSHPEYFAVGRGKSINFIWPSYIMQNALFKPGHDRVVDTENLLSQCSLKINTGKAGKDFTFSQDDTVVVSLDKAGRVKFWDVRDLTTTKEGSDPRAPMPAQSSLEVKEPLMTLASTPEGEKPWPTSVLLLDKQRPYQKQCALRYMIVGMKQNHTLQLWDLALGKPVQEFNLPHSKESDAVCSVMYHAATGMIIIGHPTRNSVYFAHLSAPKYNLKSVSQADYIQRLVGQDSSIPQPDSTAVISGVREYSFATRGILRSLDILSNPAMIQDTEEPTLFELYAMHSKGVACLLVKQAELGWSKDNKVLDAVDAVAEGVVTVAKLKPSQSIESTTASESLQTRLPVRAKESPQATSILGDTAQHNLQAVTPVKVKNEPKNEPKEADTPAHSSKEGQADKHERKSRKKKSASTNAAESTQNGVSGLSHIATTSESVKGLNSITADGVSAEMLDTVIAGMEARINTSMAESLKASLKNLQGKIDEGARARDESFNKHQLKLLDMVSEVLNENTQKVLESLIHQQFTDLVIPAVGDRAGKAVAELLNDRLGPNITSSVQKEIQSSLPLFLNRSLHSSDFIIAISERVGGTVSSHIQQELLSSLTQHLTGTFANVAAQSAQRVAGDLHQQYQEQIERMKSQHIADSNKIDQLLSYVTRLTDMVSTMAASQSSLQAEFLKFKQQPVHELPAVPGLSESTGAQSHGAGSMGYHNAPPSNAAPSHQSSFNATQSQPFMSSPQYSRGTLHMSPQGSAGPNSENVGPIGTTGPAAFAGAFSNQLSKNEADAENDLFQRIRLIEQAIHDQRYQEAMIQWIQSGKQEEIFRRCLSRYSPAKFEKLPPLMLLVVMATISKNLRPNPRLKEEVDWIEMAVRAFVENMPNYVSPLFDVPLDSQAND